MSLLRRALMAASHTGGGNGLEFPITLEEGDNGQVGVDLYNYIMEKGKEIADLEGWFTYYPSEAEKVYIFNSTINYFAYNGNKIIRLSLKPSITSILSLWINH